MDERRDHEGSDENADGGEGSSGPGAAVRNVRVVYRQKSRGFGRCSHAGAEGWSF